MILQGASGPVALLGATVVDVIGETCRPDQTVVIEDGRITATGLSSSVPIPQGTDLRDVSGRWILPGLFDLHCHLTMPPYDDVPLELFLANGVTTVRDPGGNVTRQRLLREALHSGERRGPRLLISGELLDGNPPVWPKSSLLVDTVERGTAAVRHLAAQGVDCVKIYNHVPENVLGAIIEVAHEHNLPVIGHVPRRLGMLRAVELGMNCLEHIRITGRDFLPADQAEKLDLLPVAIREPRLWELIELDQPWIGAIIDALVEHDVTLDPTLLIEEIVHGEGISGEASHADNAVLPQKTREAWQSAAVPPVLRMPDDLRDLGRRTNLKRHEFVQRCWEAGVRITAGTDGVGLGRLLPGFGLHHELALLRQAGLSGFASLRAATIEAARAVGLADRFGSIETGKAADLGVWTADPLKSQLRPTDLELVVIDGTIHQPHLLLAEAS